MIMANSSLLLFLLLVMVAGIGLGMIAAGDFAPQQVEMEAMVEALRSHGSSLFTNAIATSDLKYQLRSSSPSSSFTIFAPKDSLLYALDLVADADLYVRTLRYHVIPHCHRSFRDLHTLRSPFLHTLLPHYSLLLSNTATLHRNSSALADALMVDGVRVSYPDLFLGPTFAVHGIDGILVTGLSKYQDFNFEMEMDSTDGLGISFLPSEITPPILDFSNTVTPAIPSQSSAEIPNTATAESWNSNSNQEEEIQGGGGKRRKPRHKRRKKHVHRRDHGGGGQQHVL